MGNDFRTINTRLIVSNNMKEGFDKARAHLAEFGREFSRSLGTTIAGGVDLTSTWRSMFESGYRVMSDVGKQSGVPYAAAALHLTDFLVGTATKTADSWARMNEELKKSLELTERLRAQGLTQSGLKQFEKLGQHGVEWAENQRTAIKAAVAGDESKRQMFSRIGLSPEALNAMPTDVQFVQIFKGLEKLSALGKMGENPKMMAFQDIYGPNAWELYRQGQDVAAKLQGQGDLFKKISPPTANGWGVPSWLMTPGLNEKDAFKAVQDETNERRLNMQRAESEARSERVRAERKRQEDRANIERDIADQFANLTLSSWDKMRAGLRSKMKGFSEAEIAEQVARVDALEKDARLKPILDSFGESPADRFRRELPLAKEALDAGKLSLAQFGSFLKRSQDAFAPMPSPTTSGIAAGSAEAARFMLARAGEALQGTRRNGTQSLELTMKELLDEQKRNNEIMENLAREFIASNGVARLP